MPFFESPSPIPWPSREKSTPMSSISTKEKTSKLASKRNTDSYTTTTPKRTTDVKPARRRSSGEMFLSYFNQLQEDSPHYAPEKEAFRKERHSLLRQSSSTSIPESDELFVDCSNSDAIIIDSDSENTPPKIKLLPIKKGPSSTASHRKALMKALESSSEDEIAPLRQRIKYKPKTEVKKKVRKLYLSISSDSEDSFEMPILNRKVPELILSDSEDSLVLPSIDKIKSVKNVTEVSKLTLNSSTTPSKSTPVSILKPPTPVFKTKTTTTNDRKKLNTIQKKNVTANELLHLCKDLKTTSEINHFLSSLAAPNEAFNSTSHPDAVYYSQNFQKRKEELARKLFKIYNREVFEDRLLAEMPLTWKTRMTHTAGFCVYKRNALNIELRSACIELSIKVLDSADRLRDTLIHEMCHAATWVINGERDIHGPVWKQWCGKANKTLTALPRITTCHHYKINTKYVYKCTRCLGRIGRHTKSVDITRKVCGSCGGRFEMHVDGKLVSPAVGSPLPYLPRFGPLRSEPVKRVRKQKTDKDSDIIKNLGVQFNTQAIVSKKKKTAS